MEPEVDGFDALSKEWLRLSLKDRNNIQEEIHSVLCIAPEESPEMIEEALEKLSFELDNNIPVGEQRAYLRYKELCLINGDDYPPSTGIATKSCYINSEDFRLRFLRLELFDVPRAAHRMCRFLDCLLDQFGEDSLKEPIKLEKNFPKDELKALRKGLVQLLPFRDRLGRRILVVFPGVEMSRMPIHIKLKIYAYIFYVAGCNNDADIQRKGLVAVLWIDPTAEIADPSQITSNVRSMSSLFPVISIRPAAIHVCTPNTPKHRLGASILAAATSLLSYERTRMKFHIGTPMELRYKLNGYGIPTDSLPMSWTGNIKTSYLKQWIRVRQFIEQDSTSGSQIQRQLLVECPNLNDIIFKKGSAGMIHPGNILFRSLVQSKYEQGNLFTTKSLIVATLDEMERQGLRILTWNEKHQFFFVISDQQIIYKKIEYFVRDFQFSSTKSQKTNRRISDAIATNVSTTETPPTTAASVNRTTDNSLSATSIFRAEDGTSRKRFKPNQYQGDSSDDSSDNCEGGACRFFSC